ncbi:hypothetical protein ACIHFD_49260 [Nonomuraea sp. NPDC051941]|uniref:hypothetical protein n=1 Tax=Nonomuraea sp. NPDC051941 TaxID=3364373 RepID=UPI0037C60718
MTTSATTARISVRDIANLRPSTTTKEIAAIMTAGSQGLAAVVLAEAAGQAPPSAVGMLRSPDWCEDWLLTLVGLESSLRVSVARAEMEGHARKARANWARARQVADRIVVATKVVDRCAAVRWKPRRPNRRRRPRPAPRNGRCAGCSAPRPARSGSRCSPRLA